MEKIKKAICFTIGHSTHSIEKFIHLLMQNNINCITDVRSNPYSKHASQFNRENLKRFLKQYNIRYIDMGDQLGARYADPKLLFPDGKVDYSKVRQKKEFQSGIIRVLDGIKKGFKIALMCAEKNPLNCHRFILISYELQKKGITVFHILEDGNTTLNQELEKELLNSSKNYNSQLKLFEKNISPKNALDLAYKEKNKEIAYTNHN